jgi:threonine synthase
VNLLSRVEKLKCRNCGQEYDIAPVSICEDCFGPLEVVYDYDAIAKRVTRETIKKGPNTLFRYKEFLPIGERIVDLKPGFTPLHPAENLAEEVGLQELYIKNDSVNPTFSFKDRVVSVAVSKALDFGFDTIGCASTGNLASSVAAHGAKAGLSCYIFIPADLNLGKIIQALAYNPNLIGVEGNYDTVNRLCAEVCEHQSEALLFRRLKDPGL